MVDQIADDGGWLVICQARHDTDGDRTISVGFGMHGSAFGDRLDPYLVVGSGEGVPIDTFVTRSSDGAWFAVIRGGKLELFDGKTNRSVELRDADVRDDGSPYGDARAAVIADSGTRMTYFRHGRDRDRIVIRDLGSGQERIVAVDGSPWRMWLDDAGRWARVAVLSPGASWPVANTSLAPRGCRGPVGSYTSAGFQGERPTEQWLDLDRGVFAAAAKVPEDVKEEFEHHHRRRGGPPSSTRIWCNDNGKCEDETGKPIARPAGRVEYVHGDRLVIRSHRKVIVFDVSTRTSTPLGLADDVEGGNGPIISVGDGLYNVTTAKRIGSSRTDAVVAHIGNRVLLGHAANACTPGAGDLPYACVDGAPNLAAGGFGELPVGPLHWVP
jgi:hypothetical protein